jgi:hypothetical protein
MARTELLPTGALSVKNSTEIFENIPAWKRIADAPHGAVECYLVGIKRRHGHWSANWIRMAVVKGIIDFVRFDFLQIPSHNEMYCAGRTMPR